MFSSWLLRWGMRDHSMRDGDHNGPWGWGSGNIRAKIISLAVLLDEEVRVSIFRVHMLRSYPGWWSVVWGGREWPAHSLTSSGLSHLLLMIYVYDVRNAHYYNGQAECVFELWGNKLFVCWFGTTEDQGTESSLFLLLVQAGLDHEKREAWHSLTVVLPTPNLQPGCRVDSWCMTRDQVQEAEGKRTQEKVRKIGMQTDSSSTPSRLACIQLAVEGKDIVDISTNCHGPSVSFLLRTDASTADGWWGYFFYTHRRSIHARSVDSWFTRPTTLSLGGVKHHHNQTNSCMSLLVPFSSFLFLGPRDETNTRYLSHGRGVWEKGEQVKVKGETQENKKDSSIVNCQGQARVQPC